MPNKPFVYQDPLPLRKNDTEYYLSSSGYVSIAEFVGQEMLRVDPQTLTLLAQYVFYDASFMFRPAHQRQVASVPNGLEASENDKYVAPQFLHNPDIAAKGILLICRDIGTAITMGEKGQCVRTDGGGEAALAQGVYNTCIQDNLRCSQNAPLDIYKEVNTGTNLPAQIGLCATDDDEYELLCIVKGGGLANKIYLHQETKALIIPAKLKNYLVEKMRTLGTVACPPYHIAFMIGGTSAEAALKTIKSTSTKYYSGLLTEGNEHGQTLHDVQLEQELLLEAQDLGLGTQFGGRYFAHDIRVTHLPHHGASCPVGMGVSCSTGRNIKARTNRDSIQIEKLESSPGRYILEHLRQAEEGEAVKANFNQPMSEILALLSQYPVSTRLSLSGTIIVTRGIARARLKELIDSGGALLQHVKDHSVCYVGSTRTSDDYASSSLESTTAGRMDSYIDLLQSHGANKIMLAKGNRNRQVTDAYRKHGSFYLGSIGGSTAVLIQQNICSLEYVAYPGLGMKAIWKIDVWDFPAFILVDDKGNDFFQQIQASQCARCVK